MPALIDVRQGGSRPQKPSPVLGETPWRLR